MIRKANPTSRYICAYWATNHKFTRFMLAILNGHQTGPHSASATIEWSALRFHTIFSLLLCLVFGLSQQFIVVTIFVFLSLSLPLWSQPIADSWLRWNIFTHIIFVSAHRSFVLSKQTQKSWSIGNTWWLIASSEREWNLSHFIWSNLYLKNRKCTWAQMTFARNSMTQNIYRKKLDAVLKMWSINENDEKKNKLSDRWKQLYFRQLLKTFPNGTFYCSDDEKRVKNLQADFTHANFRT